MQLAANIVTTLTHSAALRGASGPALAAAVDHFGIDTMTVDQQRDLFQTLDQLESRCRPVRAIIAGIATAFRTHAAA